MFLNLRESAGSAGEKNFPLITQMFAEYYVEMILV